jgi:hypothetical protein
MLRKIFQPLLLVLLASLLVSACTPMVLEEGEIVFETPGVVEVETPVILTPEEQQPLIPETGSTPAPVDTPAAQDTPAAADTGSPQLPVTGDAISAVDDYDAYYGLPVYDIEQNWLGMLEHVVTGPQGLSDFALVSTWENLYRTIPVTAITLDEASGEVLFQGEMHQFMGSPTFETIGGLNFNVEAVRNAVIGYWQHQVDIQAPRQ